MIFTPDKMKEHREEVQAKFFAYLTNPTLAERNNLDEALDFYDLTIQREQAERRRLAQETRNGN